MASFSAAPSSSALVNVGNGNRAACIDRLAIQYPDTWQQLYGPNAARSTDPIILGLRAALGDIDCDAILEALQARQQQINQSAAALPAPLATAAITAGTAFRPWATPYGSPLARPASVLAPGADLAAEDWALRTCARGWGNATRYDIDLLYDQAAARGIVGASNMTLSQVCQALAASAVVTDEALLLQQQQQQQQRQLQEQQEVAALGTALGTLTGPGGGAAPIQPLLGQPQQQQLPALQELTAAAQLAARAGDAEALDQVARLASTAAQGVRSGVLQPSFGVAPQQPLFPLGRPTPTGTYSPNPFPLRTI
jgi:hypothetical protein